MPDVIIIFTGIVVFAQMYGLGTRQEAAAYKKLGSDVPLLLRSLLSVLVVVPFTAFLLIVLLPLPTYVATGLAILAAAPGAPLTSRRSEAAAADFQYVSALQILSALFAVLYTPIVLLLFSRHSGTAITPVSPVTIAGQVGLVTFVPAVLGWLSALAAPRLRERHNRFVALASKGLYLLFLVVLVLALVALPDLRASLAVGWLAAVAIITLCGVALTSGFFLGGPDKSKRGGLAIASVARNIGLAVFIAEQSETTYASIPTILLFAVVGVCLALPFSGIIKRL